MPNQLPNDVIFTIEQHGFVLAVRNGDEHVFKWYEKYQQLWHVVYLNVRDATVQINHRAGYVRNKKVNHIAHSEHVGEWTIPMTDISEMLREIIPTMKLVKPTFLHS